MKKTLVKIAVAIEEKDKPCWPHINHDSAKELNRILDTVFQRNADIAFDVVSYTDCAEAQADYAEDVKKYDGVLVLDMACWKDVDLFYARQAKGGIPTIVADVPYCGSGSVLMRVIPAVRDEKLPVPVLSTLDYTEIADAVRLFDVVAKMKQTTILVVCNNRRIETEAFEEEWGVKFIYKTSGDMNAYLKEINPEDAKVFAERWINDADEVLEASEEEILRSAVLHLAIKKMMADCQADAVTLDCLDLSYEGSYDNNEHMYPCLSHFEMLNNGIVAVCEADITATISSLVIQYLTQRPGYVSDPLIDTSSNQIVYAHCVACKNVFGCADARKCRYTIRSHAEDKKGASVQVFFPLNEPLTTVMVRPSKFMPSTIHSSRAVGNVGFQEACRSKLAAETNAQAVLDNWTEFWHRVTVFGDYRKQFMNLFKMKGLAVIEEDKQ